MLAPRAREPRQVEKHAAVCLGAGRGSQEEVASHCVDISETALNGAAHGQQAATDGVYGAIGGGERDTRADNGAGPQAGTLVKIDFASSVKARRVAV